MGYKGVKLHPVAGKCGVFAETDINGLQKMGVPPDELMASLFEAIVMQNLSVLTRGNTLLPVVLLLGGPNCYIKGMRDCWKSQHPENLGRAQHAAARRRSARRPDQDARQRAVLRRHRLGRIRQDRRRRRRPVPRLRKAGVVRQRRPRGGESQARRRRRAGQGRSRPGGVQAEVPHQEVHSHDVPAGRSGGRLRRHRRRLHLHQGRAAFEGTQAPHPGQDLPAFQGQPHRGHDRGAAKSSNARFRTRARS